MYPDATFSYCNITFAYSHAGRDDQVLVTYWLLSPSTFQNRFLTTGGGGYAINSGNMSVAGGIPYGAVAGLTDGGFGGFDQNFDDVFPTANGTANWWETYMWGYQAIHEMTVIGQAFTKNFFDMGNSTKLYSYYQGCSEGGREGWSQVQRFPDQFDGAITGAPAFRFSFQQVQHMWSNIAEKEVGYAPPTCELDQIANATIKACDPLDGKVDGVAARTDLCKLHFNMSTIIGQTYSCPATTAIPMMDVLAAPAQNGTVSAKGVEVARGSWELLPQAYATEFVQRLIGFQNSSTFANLDGVTADTLRDWSYEGFHRYQDTLETTWPDLTAFQQAGGKVLHYHGESDNSIPTASSVRYHESVRRIMYPDMSYNASSAALSEWYKLFLVPGAAHCSAHAYQPNAPFPQTNLQSMIDWGEKGVEPKTLNATVVLGDCSNQQICQWPRWLLWKAGEMECVYDQASIDTWHYDLDAFKLPIY